MTCRRRSSTWSDWGPEHHSPAARCRALWRNSLRKAPITPLATWPSPSCRAPVQRISEPWFDRPLARGSLVSLAEGDFVYIHNEGDGTEELFNERDDPRELTNRARDDSMKPILERFRHYLAKFNASRSGPVR